MQGLMYAYLGGPKMGYRLFHSFLNSSFYIDSVTQIPFLIPTSTSHIRFLRKSSKGNQIAFAPVPLPFTFLKVDFPPSPAIFSAFFAANFSRASRIADLPLSWAVDFASLLAPGLALDFLSFDFLPPSFTTASSSSAVTGKGFGCCGGARDVETE